jgi:hypothetical protein
MKNILHCDYLTGGVDKTYLDYWDGNSLSDKDKAYVIAASVFYVYELDADSGLAESSPNRIVPDTNPGTKVWILITSYSLTSVTTSVTAADNTSTTAIATTAFAKSQLAVLARDPDPGIALTAAASGSNGITVADDDDLDMGTNSFAPYFNGLVPDFTPAADLILVQKWTSNVGYELGIKATTGYIYLKLNTTTYTSSVAPSAVDGTKHFILPVVTVGAVNTTVDFYFDAVALGTQQSAANPGTVSNAAALYILGTSTTRTAGTVNDVGLLNFAPTAAEVLDMYRNGIPESWKWGSQTNQAVNGGFTGSATSWSLDAGWAYYSNNVATAAAANTTGCYQSLGRTIKIGEQWLVTFTVGGYSSGSVVARLGSSYGTTRSADGTYTEIITCTEENQWIGIFAKSDNVSLIVDGVSYIKLGATFAITPKSFQPDKPYDLSTNNAVCAYPASGWSLTRPPAESPMQPTPTDGSTGAVTVTIAMILNGIITGNPSAARAYTFETGATSDAWPSLQIDRGYEWSIINTNATYAVTLTAASGHTIVGGAVVALSTTGRFCTRKISAGVFETYRIA